MGQDSNRVGNRKSLPLLGVGCMSWCGLFREGGFVFFRVFRVIPASNLSANSGKGGAPRAQGGSLIYGYVYTSWGGLHVLGIILLYSLVGSLWWGGRTTGYLESPWVWWLLLVALLAKVPCYGLHLWLPKAHVEAPTGRRMLLAGVMLKLGTYGVIVYGAMLLLSPLSCLPVVVLGAFGLFYCGPAMLIQPDIKSLAAYSSVLHMGGAMCSLSTQTPLGTQAALLISVGHGFASSCVFALVGILHRVGLSRNPLLLGGVRSLGRPLFFMLFLGIFLANGTPPFFSFYGELVSFVHLGCWGGVGMVFVLLASGLLCPAAYFLVFFRASHGAFPAGAYSAAPSSLEIAVVGAHVCTLVVLFAFPGLFVL